ncbi:MAG: DUF4190 domain-containing protein [Clostridia bacterium]|nr:DUF4190 domain-containing protein [Clostridia bacterium]
MDRQYQPNQGQGYNYQQPNQGYNTNYNYQQPNQGYNANYQQPYPQPYPQPYAQQQNQPTPPASNKTNPVSIVSLICGIVGFCFNPFYFTTLAAIICGIVGIATAKNSPKGMAIAGLILGICATGCQVLFDILTFGMGIFF